MRHSAYLVSSVRPPLGNAMRLHSFIPALLLFAFPLNVDSDKETKSQPHTCTLQSYIYAIPFEKLDKSISVLKGEGFYCQGLYVDNVEVKYEPGQNGVYAFSSSYVLLNISKTRAAGSVIVSFLTDRNQVLKDSQDHFEIGPSKNGKSEGSAAISQILIDRSLLPTLDKIQVTIVLK